LSPSSPISTSAGRRPSLPPLTPTAVAHCSAGAATFLSYDDVPRGRKMVEALDVALELPNRPLPGGLECSQLARVARLGAGAKPRGVPSFDRSGKCQKNPTRLLR
jgi:hypothetical protein